MAFDVDLTTYEGTALPWDGKGRMFVAKKRVDFTQSANYLATTKLMAIMKIPANTWILAGYAKVITADTDITDTHLGLYTDGSTVIDADGLLDSLSFATVGWKTTTLGVLNFLVNSTGVGYLATTDCYLTLYDVDSDTINEAVVDFFVLCSDFGF